jgi:hypothetical protein
LTERYNGENRFEVDGANAAREFLKERERYANHRLVIRGRTAIEARHSSEVTNLPLVGKPIG